MNSSIVPSRRLILRSMLAVSMLAVIVTSSAFLPRAPAADESNRPNVLFIVADDLNADLACYGHPFVKTPHLDALARRGVLFDRAYCQNPLCVSSRASFLSGLRPGTKVTANSTFLPEYFHQHGYYTVEMNKVTHGWGVTHTSIDWDAKERRASPERMAAAIDTARQKNKPFFIAIGLTHTHLGLAFDRDVLAQYPADKIPLPEEPADFRATVPPRAFDGIWVPKWSADELRAHRAKYFAAITTLDRRVGELLGALDDRKARESTIVVFTSDHGHHIGEHGGIIDKRTLFENSARVPLIVAAPGRVAGERSPRLVELVDLFPTLADLCGLPVPEQLEGTSFVPLLKKPQRDWKQAAFTSSAAGPGWGHSIRTERYRYAQWREGEAAFLFDYETDPAETRNVVDDPKYAETAAKLKRLLQQGYRNAVPREP